MPYIIRDLTTGAEIEVEHPSQMRAVLRQLPRVEDFGPLPPDEVLRRWESGCAVLAEGQQFRGAHELLAVLKRQGRRRTRSRDLMRLLDLTDFRGLGRRVSSVMRFASAARLPPHLLLFRRTTAGIRYFWPGEALLRHDLPPVPPPAY